MILNKYKRHILWFCIFCIVQAALLFLVVSYRNFMEEDRYDYGILVKIENKSDDDIIAAVFPIPASKESLDSIYVEKAKIQKGRDNGIWCYAGNEKDLLKNTLLGIAVWKTLGEKDVQIFQREPYAVKAFYNPEFEIGPEKYGIFVEWIVK